MAGVRPSRSRDRERSVADEGPTAQRADCLWLLDFSPDQVHRSPSRGPLIGDRLDAPGGRIWRIVAAGAGLHLVLGAGGRVVKGPGFFVFFRGVPPGMGGNSDLLLGAAPKRRLSLSQLGVGTAVFFENSRKFAFRAVLWRPPRA